MSLNMRPTSINNGSGQAYRAFDIDGLVHPTKPINQLIPLSIYNLESNKVKRFSLNRDINFDLAVVSFYADVTVDDNIVMPESDRPPSDTSASLNLYVLEEEKVVNHITFRFTSSPTAEFAPIIFDHTKKFDIRLSTNATKITFFCEPVYLLPAIDIVVPNKNVTIPSNINQSNS